MRLVFLALLASSFFGCNDGQVASTVVLDAYTMNNDLGATLDASLEDVGDSPDARPELPGPEATFNYRVGVESVTIFDASPGAQITLINADGDELLGVIADPLGQAHFAYIPDEFAITDSSGTTGLSLNDADVLRSGDGYVLRDDSSEPPSWTYPFRVASIDDLPDESVYADQSLVGLPVSLLSGPSGDVEEGYQYISMRDGVSLSAMIRFPDPILYGTGPFPTVIEYSGYSPSNPERADTPARIAGAMGYATVSVNMRGTGCSGGVFDFFNRAQQADGYDIIETVARQSWVLNNHVGMVGLSYPGISQLYTASTNPPSLAAIIPLSTIADAWEMQWPGGVYNAGFTRQWVDARESAASAGGTSWVSRRIEEGDVTCEQNLTLSAYGFDFETVLKEMSLRPSFVEDRNLNRLVEQIIAPVFYGGAFQDEQTGASFGHFLDRFTATSSLKVLITNGRHPDGYAPHAAFRWYEFLEFYVAKRIPVLNSALRIVGAEQFGDSFGMETASFEEDRFTEYETHEAALAAYEAEPTVRLLFESGAGEMQPGTPVFRFETQYDKWPPEEALPIEWYGTQDGQLTAAQADTNGSHTWQLDPEAGNKTFFGPSGYQLSRPLWDIDWSYFAAGNILAYETPEFETSKIIAGPGIAELWVNSPVDDVTVQITLTEVRPDGFETLIQSGWLRLGHRTATEGANLRLARTYSQADYDPIPIDTWIPASVTIPSVAHPMRAGSKLRMLVSTPGRDHGTWEFTPPVYEDDSTPTFQLGYGPDHPTRLRMVELPNIEIPETYPPCPSLRGQPCREYRSIDNQLLP
jgi:uncharacterized protein